MIELGQGQNQISFAQFYEQSLMAGFQIRLSVQRTQEGLPMQQSEGVKENKEDRQNQEQDSHQQQPWEQPQANMDNIFRTVKEEVKMDQFKVEIISENIRLNKVKPKNQTKNIPKNFGKGIIRFMEQNKRICRQLLLDHGLNPRDVFTRLKQRKTGINTIAQLRSLWVDDEASRCLRIISNEFIRKHSLHYIFHSRIRNYSSHLKYRQSLLEALKHPEDFNHIKNY